MLSPELEGATQFLATHALLLGVGMLAAAASIGAIVWAAHLAARVGPGVRRQVATVANRIQEIPVLHRLIHQAHGVVPSAYLALHLALGFVMAGALAVFATVAEEALAGGEMAAFDLAFARGTRRAAPCGIRPSLSCRGPARVRLWPSRRWR